ncbi:hypothetical protein HWV23_02640 [Natronomonas halophila]|uniref:hypothetical protein n=1 Tax=Natronomonas halophila TaxID=2747817 RepID=UPI0015B3BB27|nr:hypothetical protein [Natronomonas halophila]QLD84597.1 hypothetical protein HWV23_02355 [Natronomonas halophila]QLD84653.1 hypothetical protein HWV23_02640 [Natronomonas halophila]
MAAATPEPDVDVSAKQLESVRGYISMLLNLEIEDLDDDADLEDDDVQIVTEVTVDEVAKNTLPREPAVRAILEQMAGEAGTGVEHVDGDTYEIEPRN